MNIISKLRKPKLSIFLSALILFVSCDVQQIDNLNEDKSNITLEEYASKHITLTNALSNLLLLEKNIDLEILENSADVFEDNKALRALLNEANIVNIDSIEDNILAIQNNTNNYLRSSSNNSISQIEYVKIIANEIDTQLESKYEDGIFFAKSSCMSRFRTAVSRCERNWYIGVAALGVSAFFTLGIGSIVGAAVVGGQLLLCHSDAQSDYDNCMGE